MKKLSERIAILEKAGVDTSIYTPTLTGGNLSINNSQIHNDIVEDVQLENKKLFRRWITAQTFKMLQHKVRDPKDGKVKCDWNVYLRVMYSYDYTFKMMLKEVDDLRKLEIKDKEEFEERSHFFTQEVVVKTCEHYIKQLWKYIENKKKDRFVRLSKYGKVNIYEIDELFVNELRNLAEKMNSYSDDYNDIYHYLKDFMFLMNKLPYETPKCTQWKDAFKGSGAYYSLKNMILYHGVLLRDCSNKQESMHKLSRYLELYQGQGWRFHEMLKDTIKLNNFDLRESINRNK